MDIAETEIKQNEQYWSSIIYILQVLDFLKLDNNKFSRRSSLPKNSTFLPMVERF